MIDCRCYADPYTPDLLWIPLDLVSIYEEVRFLFVFGHDVLLLEATAMSSHPLIPGRHVLIAS